MTCNICGNEPVERPVTRKWYVGMGKWKNKTTWEPVCDYCEWNGSIGMGLLLKETIAQINREDLR